MERDRSHPSQASGLDWCPECHRPFVVPVALLDFVDEGVYLVALHCANCDRLALGVHDDAEMEAVELAFDRGTSQIRAALEIVEVSRFIDALDGFSRALEQDLVLPEDF